jgi:hypothetical protein
MVLKMVYRVKSTTMAIDANVMVVAVRLGLNCFGYPKFIVRVRW